jgi:Ca2+-binding RTX toxin-like protein
VIGLSLVKAINGTARGDTLVGTAGDDRLTGGEGADLITTGAGRDVLVYTSLRDALDTVTDFTPGSDRIDLTAITASLRAANPAVTDLVQAGFIQLVDTAAGVQVRIDSDGFAGTGTARPLVTLRGQTAAQILVSRDLIL